MDTKQLEQLSHRLMTKHNITFDCGAQYSVKCQFAQLENIIRDVIKETRVDAAKQALFNVGKLINEEDRMPKNARSFAVAHVLNELSELENSDPRNVF